MLRFSNIASPSGPAPSGRTGASLLGIPVKRLQTVVWPWPRALVIGVFLQAGILGLPSGST